MIFHIKFTTITKDGTRVIIAVGNRVLLYNAETGDLLESLRGLKYFYFIYFTHSFTH